MTDKPLTKIHYLEDSNDEAFLSGLLLKSQNVRAELVHHMDYKELLKVVRASEPEEAILVFVDLNMPGFKGDEVIGTILGNTDRKNLLIGICSGSEDPADKRAAHDAGAHFFVNKPLDLKSITTICETNDALKLKPMPDGIIDVVWSG